MLVNYKYVILMLLAAQHGETCHHTLCRRLKYPPERTIIRIRGGSTETTQRIKLPIFQVDAFCDQVFRGNPAAVVPVMSKKSPDNSGVIGLSPEAIEDTLTTKWYPLNDELMQKIAFENNLSETVYYSPLENKPGEYLIRFFTPTTEVELCGHGTMAAAFVIFEAMQPHERKTELLFHSQKRGILKVTKESGTDLLSLDFPADVISTADDLKSLPLKECFGSLPDETFLGTGGDYLMVYASAAEVKKLRPTSSAILKYFPATTRGIICTAPGDSQGEDFVSRWFGPHVGVDEDPVTGSAHTTLAVYWGKRLHKDRMRARQVSARGGLLECSLTEQGRVAISGSAVCYMKGEISLS